MFEIGNSLREARLRQGLDLSDVERVTKVRPKYLRALEEETFEALPAQTYVKGFLRTYAEFLGLDGQLYVDEYNSRYVTRDSDDPPFRPRRSPAGRGRGGDSSMILGAIVGIAVVFALVIAAWKSGDATPPPQAPVVQRPAVDSALVVRAVGGSTQVEVRDRSRFGNQRFLGTVVKGREQRVALRRQLWLWIQRPNAVEVVVAGKRQRLSARRPTAYLVTTRGATPAR